MHKKEKRKKKIVILTGVHGAGKTTLGKSIETMGKFAFYEELGRNLQTIVSCNVTNRCYLFEREVMRLETQRDSLLVREPLIPVVESWHIANIAFAKARGNFEIAQSYLNLLDQSLEMLEPLVVILKIDDTTFAERMSELNVSLKVVLAFYRLVEKHIDELTTASKFQHVNLDASQSKKTLVQSFVNWFHMNENG